MAILEIKNLHRHFGGVTAIQGVNLSFLENELRSIIGPNGAGKTTLFNVITGRIQASSGRVIYHGNDIPNKPPHEVARLGICRTFQKSSIFPGLTVFENVVAASLFGTKRAISVPDAEREATGLLEFVELSTAAAMLAKDLPIGSRKRLEVARALATKPDLLMFDEVMAGLNPAEVAQAMELVRKIRSKGITIFMIEHVMKAIMNVCDRIIVLHHGSKIAEGTPQEIATSRTVVEVYLGE